MTQTISGLVANFPALLADLTGTAAIEVTDKNGITKGATFAQLRTALFAGGTGYAAGDQLVVGGHITLATNAAYLQAKTTGGATVNLLSLTADSNNITRFICGVDAAFFQWTNQAQSAQWGALSSTGLVINGSISAGGSIITFTDNAYDIGTAFTRFRNLYISNTATFGTVTIGGGPQYNLRMVGDGATDRLRFYNSVAGSGAGIDAANAAESAYAPFVISGAPLYINATLAAYTDNSFDIGAPGANRFKNLYLAGNVIAQSSSVAQSYNAGIANGGTLVISGLPTRRYFRLVLQSNADSSLYRVYEVAGDGSANLKYTSRSDTTGGTLTITSSTPSSVTVTNTVGITIGILWAVESPLPTGFI